MGNSRAIIPIVISLVLALGGSYFLYRWIKVKTQPAKVVTVKETQAVPVVVAKVNITWGTRINAEMLTVKSFLEGSVPKGHFSDPLGVAGRILVTPLFEGEPVLEQKLAPADLQAGGISAVLKPGTRAISVQGNRVLGIAGLIHPGNRVDVLVTINDPAKKEPITKIVLENLLVLAAGTQIVKNSKGEPSPVDVFTMEVTPDQGERLTLAANKGKLQFALRGAVDTDMVATRGITIPEMLRSHLPPKAETHAPEKVPSPPTRKKVSHATKRPRPGKMEIEIIKGLKVEKEQIRL